MLSNFIGAVNIGSDEIVTVDRLVDMVVGIAGKSIDKCDWGAWPQFRQSAQAGASCCEYRRLYRSQQASRQSRDRLSMVR
jgi:hypothetical protein